MKADSINGLLQLALDSRDKTDVDDELYHRRTEIIVSQSLFEADNVKIVKNLRSIDCSISVTILVEKMFANTPSLTELWSCTGCNWEYQRCRKVIQLNSSDLEIDIFRDILSHKMHKNAKKVKSHSKLCPQGETKATLVGGNKT